MMKMHKMRAAGAALLACLLSAGMAAAPVSVFAKAPLPAGEYASGSRAGGALNPDEFEEENAALLAAEAAADFEGLGVGDKSAAEGECSAAVCSAEADGVIEGFAEEEAILGLALPDANISGGYTLDVPGGSSGNPAGASGIPGGEEAVNGAAGSSFDGGESISAPAAAEHPAEYYINYFDQLNSAERNFYKFIGEQKDLTPYSYDSDTPSEERLRLSYKLPEDEYVQIACEQEEFDSRAYRQTDEYQAFYVSKVKAYDCWLKDHPRLFWANGINTVIKLTYDKDTHIATIYQVDFSLRRYYKGILDEIDDVDAALEEVIAKVGELMGEKHTRYDAALTAASYINSHMTYDTEAAVTLDTSRYGYAHTITGPLLDKYGHKGVCEAYSKLFKIICDEYKVPAIIVIGRSESVIKQMDHMWNDVLMRDGKWYIVDITFGGATSDSKWFMAGTESGAGTRNHIEIGRFSNGVDYEPVIYPPLAEEKYVPGDEPEDPAENMPVWNFVGRLYSLVLQREPDEEGQRSWYKVLTDGSDTGAHVAYGFIFSKEYTDQENSDEEYVSMLYRTMMDREPDEAGLASWLNVLRQGFSRKKILEGFAKSAEFAAICDSYGILTGEYRSGELLDSHAQITLFVARLYLVCLGRDVIDADGQRAWVSAIVDGASGGKVARGFFGSAEFEAAGHGDEEFLTILYRTMMNREPDEGGMQTWLRSLESGNSRYNVLVGFIKSVEFGRLCDFYAIRSGADEFSEVPAAA